MARRKGGGNTTRGRTSATLLTDATATLSNDTLATRNSSKIPTPISQRRTLTFFNTQLGSTLAGVFLGFALGMVFAAYQSRVADRSRLEERLQDERVALTEEISPWLLELYHAISPAANINLSYTTQVDLKELGDSVARFTLLPRTMLLSARLRHAFSPSIQLQYDSLIRKNAEIFILLGDLHSYRDGNLYRQNGEKHVTTSADLSRILGELSPKVEAAIIAAYNLGEELRTKTYALSPPQAVSSEEPPVLTCTSAELVGVVLLNGAITDGWFEWGTTKRFGNATSKAEWETGWSNQGELRQKISGLSPKTVYYWRIAVSNPRGSAYGDRRSFTTPDCN